jgi:GNAT superfamily N-acetyltransferase
MPRLADPDAIRRLLRADPVWGVYALGDLSPAMFPKTQWFAPDLTLVLHEYGTSILFAMGTASVREALDHVTWPVHLQVKEDALSAIGRHATVTSATRMWRMGRHDAGPLPHVAGGAVRLGAADVPALAGLYADGQATGESPDFFFPSMVTDGVFFGVYDGGALTAAAGTHLLSRDEGVAALGNVYTRRDRRGRGLGRVVTAAVLAGLAGIETVGLNVSADNRAAIHLYESLGFVRHCPFVEAVATGWS